MYLSFEDRQRAWTGEVREFRALEGRAQRPVVWKIWVKGDRVFTEHGQLGGAVQQTSYQGRAKNLGRSNALTAEEDALAEARRDCRKKWDFGGMSEFINGIDVDRRAGKAIDIPTLLSDLPGSFSLYKPENNIEDCPKLLEKIAAGSSDIHFTVKRNGEALFFVVKEGGEIDVYSRRGRKWHHHEGPREREDGTLDDSLVRPWRDRFGYLVDQVRALDFPPWTMLAGELCFWRAGKGDDQFYIASVMRSKTDEAVRLMELREEYPTYVVWDIPFYAGQDLVTHAPVSQRWTKILDHLCPETRAQKAPHVEPLQLDIFSSVEQAKEFARHGRLEGYVAVDHTSTYGDRGWNLLGKPYRPRSCAKVKPEAEDDFVCLWDPEIGGGTWGSGKHERGKQVTLPSGEVVEHGGVGSIALCQYNAQGELVYICDCGGGLDYETQAKLRKEDFPFVAEVQYTARTYQSEGAKTNALQFPRFIRIKRTDKRADECINPQL